MKKLKLMIVDDHAMVRLGLHSLLEAFTDLQIVAEACNGSECLEKVPKANPDVILLDFRLPDIQGDELCRRMRSIMPQTKVVILTSFLDESTLHRCLASGANGFLLKEADADHLHQAIVQAFEGQMPIDPSATQYVAKYFRTATEGVPAPLLTPQEEKIVTLVAEGLINKEIGSRLGLSEKTIKNNLSAIFTKLGLSRRTELVLWHTRRQS